MHLVWLGSFAVTLFFFVQSSPAIHRYDDPNIKPASAAYFRELRDVVPYESTAKMVFRIRLPTFRQLPNPPKGKNLYGIGYNTTKLFLDDYTSFLTSMKQSKKQKRQVLAAIAGVTLGYVFHSIFAPLSNRFFGSEGEASTQIQQLERSLQQQRKEFLFFQEEIHKHSQQVTQAFWHLNTDGPDWSAGIIVSMHLTQMKIVIDKVQRGFTKCLHGNIPYELIGISHLEDRFASLNANMSRFGYRLAIDPRNIVQLEKITMADCFFTNEFLDVLINVPVIKSDWKILQLFPIPFSFSKQVCVLNPNNPEIVAISGDVVKIIDNYFMSYCDVRKNFLCMIPNMLPSNHQSACASFLRNGGFYSEGIGKCPCVFTCTTTDEQSVIQVEPAKLIASNMKSLMIDCKDRKYKVHPPQVGALEIRIKCNCKYHIGPKIIIGDQICIDDNVNTFVSDDIVHIVPDFLFDAGREIKEMNKDWPINIPVLNFTPSAEIPSLDSYSGPMKNRDWWTMALSAICFCTAVFSITVCCWWRRFKLSTRTVG